MSTCWKHVTVVLIMGLLISSCYEPFPVSDIPTGQSRLVVEASIDWHKGTDGREQTIRLETSSSYYDTVTGYPAIGAMVKIKNDASGMEYYFEDQGDGTYATTEFLPILNDSYTLEIEYDEEIYRGTEVMLPLVEIDSINQSIENDNYGEYLQLNVFFDDMEHEQNYYYITYRTLNWWDSIIGVYDEEVLSDKFTNGNRQHVFSDFSTLFQGRDVEVRLYSISKSYHDFLQSSLARRNSDDINSPPPITVRGNCVNMTNEDHFSVGYFRLTQVEERLYQFAD